MKAQGALAQRKENLGAGSLPAKSGRDPMEGVACVLRDQSVIKQSEQRIIRYGAGHFHALSHVDIHPKHPSR